MKQLLLTIATCLVFFSSISQVRVKSLDPEMMKDKVLYIQDYNPEDPLIQKWVRKGKDSKVSAAQEYASLWSTVMEESSWDVTPYEIRTFETKKMIKSKDPKALLMSIYAVATDCGNSYVYNWYASVTMTGPKKKVIATALINNLDWYEKDDLRLIVNMLSNSLNEAIEAYEEEQGSKFKATKSAYKQNFVNFVSGIGDKTFLVLKAQYTDFEMEEYLNDPEIKDGKKKKRQKRQAKLIEKDENVEEALKAGWNICEYEMVFEEDLLEYRDGLSEDHFFWINIPVNTCSPLMDLIAGNNRNHLFSTNGDKVLAAFRGKGKMKPATVENVQNKLVNKAERYKKQLN